MKLGAVFPSNQIGSDPSVIRDFAQCAEELGYAHIVIPDHVVGAVHEGRDPPLSGVYTVDDPFHEPLTLLGFMAAVTTRIQFMPGVVVAPQRQTTLLAKQVAQLAILSGDRLRLGVGTGWNYVEYGALGADFAARGAVLDEQIEVLRTLWTERVVEFEGRYHSLDRVGINPRPAKPVPIWMGGATAVAFRRAARIGDGFIFVDRPNVYDHAKQLRAALEQSGKDPATFGMEIEISFGLGPSQWRERADIWQGLGATHLSMRTMRLMQATDVVFERPQQHIEALSAFMAEMKGS